MRALTRLLPLGTRSVLCGAHQFLLHPLFVFAAWWQLYGFPADPRLYVAFIVHDLGYVGKRDMDGVEGQFHPELGGRIMTRLFGPQWGAFTRRHSRYYARLEGAVPSPLCAADKLATALVPAWLYIPLVRLSGELPEYMALARQADFYHGSDPYEWFRLLSADWRAIAEGQATGQRADWGTLTSREGRGDA
jgi:hypothetical protein